MTIPYDMGPDCRPSGKPLENLIPRAPWCPCGHGEDDICLNGAIYGPCGLPECSGSCDPDAGTCRSLPGCCAEKVP